SDDQALLDTITELTDLKNAHITTYIVGMGAGVDPALNPAAAATLKAMAIAGGTSNYFPGISPQAVTNDLETIFGAIDVNNVSTTAASVNSTSLNTGTVVYQAKFDSAALPYGDWTGELQAFPVSSTGTVNIQTGALWSAASALDTDLSGTGWQSRTVATWNPTAASGAGAGVPFAWSDLSATQQGELETLWGTLSTSEQSAFGGNIATYGQAVLDYLVGDTADQQPSGPFRDRSALLGDIVDSNPVYVGPPDGTYTASSYQTFAQDLANRTPVLYVGANDGMLHAFNALTGQELFTYVPNGVFANLANLTNPTYNQEHEFFVDGSPTAGDVQFSDGSWHTLLTGGLNAGGNSIYAIDITHPSLLQASSGLASHVLWEFSNPYLGLTYSQPQIAQIDLDGLPTSVVIFGSGYNNVDGNPYLFVVNAETGALIEQISLCSDVPSACNSSAPNGLATPVVVPSAGTGYDDLVYVGDLQGNLWRVDLSSPTPIDWTASVLYQAVQSHVTQPITTKPVVTLAPPGAPAGSLLVMFGTGQFLGTPDLTTTATQSFYGVLDQTPPGGTPPANPPGISKLVQQVLTDTTYSYTNTSGATVTLPVRTITNNTINWSSDDGWYVNLDPGERVITNPTIEGGGIIFTSYIPDAATATSCSNGGTSFLMVLDYESGGAFPGPQLDLNGGSTLNASDQVGGQNPVGIGLGNGFAAAPTLIRTRPGVIGDVKLITLSTDTIASWKERSGNRGRLNWKEIR
ncbi:type 4 fimbrial biogenesis protein PilY1, partial [mine drainage metagenome]